jgi:hypothetical protein
MVAPAAFADKYDGVKITFDQPLESVQKAAIDALTTVGVDIKKQEPNYLEGKRHHKVGAFVGSGGEILSVSLTAVDADHTEAKVRTTKTMLGRAGQKVWDQAVVDEMTKSLGGAEKSPSQEPAAASS